MSQIDDLISMCTQLVQCNQNLTELISRMVHQPVLAPQDISESLMKDLEPSTCGGAAARDPNPMSDTEKLSVVGSEDDLLGYPHTSLFSFNTICIFIFTFIVFSIISMPFNCRSDQFYPVFF